MLVSVEKGGYCNIWGIMETQNICRELFKLNYEDHSNNRINNISLLGTGSIIPQDEQKCQFVG